ncbi:MAG: STAS domain-containing protein [Actinobacteria bacterium]|nr:STAS domain-containing protein [Actinomycetota bacterium]
MTTATIATPTPLLPRRGAPVIECGTARIRAQARHLATVVSVYGEVTEANVDDVTACVRRFLLPETPIVLDICGVHIRTTRGLELIGVIDEHCAAIRVPWLLVATDAMVEVLALCVAEDLPATASSVPAALHQLADWNAAWRSLLLPLFKKPA